MKERGLRAECVCVQDALQKRSLCQDKCTLSAESTECCAQAHECFNQRILQHSDILSHRTVVALQGEAGVGLLSKVSLRAGDLIATYFGARACDGKKSDYTLQLPSGLGTVDAFATGSLGRFANCARSIPNADLQIWYLQSILHDVWWSDYNSDSAGWFQQEKTVAGIRRSRC
jgi:hypothetical protein